MVGKLAIPLPYPCDGIRNALPNNHVGETHHAGLPYQDLPIFIEELRMANASMPVKLAFDL